MKGWWYLRCLAWGNLKSAQVVLGMWRKLSQPLGWVLQNLSFSKWDIPNLPKLWHFTSFHISLFVNTTAKVLNSYTILHMWMEVIICQLDSSLWKVDDISDPWHGGTSNQLRWEKECGENFPNFWQWLLQNPSFSEQDIPNLPKFWHFTSFTFLYLSILQLW